MFECVAQPFKPSAPAKMQAYISDFLLNLALICTDLVSGRIRFYL